MCYASYQSQKLQSDYIYNWIIDSRMIECILSDAERYIKVHREQIGSHQQNGEHHGEPSLEGSINRIDIERAHWSRGVKRMVHFVAVLPEKRNLVLDPMAPVQEEIANQLQFDKAYDGNSPIPARGSSWKSIYLHVWGNKFGH
jgi:hypothetical protein